MKKILPYFLSVLVLLILWQVISCIVDSSFIVPKPVDVFVALAKLVATKNFWNNLTGTVARVFISFALSLFFGTAIGFFCGRSEFLKRFFSVPLTILRATPVVALILILIFALKSNDVPIAVSLLMTLPLVVSSISSGFEKNKNDMQLLEMAQTFRFSRSKIIRYVHIPKLLPFFKSAVVSSFGMTWKVVVAGEVLCHPKKSLGNILSTAQISIESEQVFAITISIILLCFAFEKLISCLFVIVPKILKAKKLSLLKKNLQQKNFTVQAQPHVIINRKKMEPLQIKDLNISFGESDIFKNYSVAFDCNKITAIVAPSGKGKTTLLRHIAKTFDQVSVCFQEPRLLENESVILNVVLPLASTKSKTDIQDYARAFAILKIFGMENKIFADCKTLSGGERQRVNLVRSIIFQSNILLLDEPFSAIDVATKSTIMSFIKKEQESNPRTIIFVTHDKSESDFLADKIVPL